MAVKKNHIREYKIGIIGLGTMGGKIASKFIKKGYTVYIFDINKKVLKKYEDLGARVCNSPKEAAQYADIIFEVTINDDTSKNVWYGNAGIISGATENKILITCATLSASWVDEIAQACSKRSLTFFDMAMTVEYGKISLLCGGDKKKLGEIKPLLRTFAGKIRYFGLQGQGIRYKLLLNFLQAVQIIAFGQAMKIASAEHMDLDKVITALTEKISETTINFVLEDFEKEPEITHFTIDGITKDLIYAKSLAKNLDVTLLDNVLRAYKKEITKGNASKSWFSINTSNNS